MSVEEILEILDKNIIIIGIPVKNVIFAILTLIIGYFIAILASKYVKKVMLKAKIAEILAEFSSRVFRVFLIIVIVMVAIGFFGVNIGEAVIGISVASGFIIGFAFQDTLGNLAAGFLIAITKPFRVGDYVDTAGKSGKIISVGASITKMTTVDNKRIIIPNSKIWGEPIVNYTALNQRMIDMRIGIGYKDDMAKAINITMDVLKKNKYVLKDPAPNVAIANLGDSSVDLLVRPWVNTNDYWNAKWEITQQIKDAFDKNKISIPFPQRDVHLYQNK
ncbi:MAG: mechanosensitive ion channel [Thermoplasmatales archaeon]|nr:MAG: mechanosensitive ion channel [Thermoplasmatales archaeon]